MNKLFLLALTSSIAAAGMILVDPPVNLQANSPGVKQTGHINVSGNVIGSTFSATSNASSARAVSGSATSPTGFSFGGWFQSASADGRGVFGNATSPTGTNYGGYFRTVSTGGRGVVGESLATSGTTFGGFFQSNSPDGRGVYGTAAATTGINYGGRFQTNSSSGRGVYGEAAATSGANFGGYFLSASNAGVGAYARNSSHGVALRAESSGTALEVLGFASFGGSALFGGTVNFVGTPPFNVGNSTLITNLNADKLDGKDSSAFLETVPVPLILSGNQINGVLRVDNSSFAGPAISGISGGSNGHGVFGQGLVGVRGFGLTGVEGKAFAEQGIGVYGYSQRETTATYGVQGEVSANNPAAFGVYSTGNMGASGTKPFRIDHPFDPANKYLFHYSSESPLPQNFYNGNVRTDASGQAWVTLPDYFEEINKDFKYTLTVVDDTDSADFVQVKVAKKIHGNRFKIRTSAPNVEVSWRVDALRNDKWVQKNPPLTEPLKEGREKGTYQHPELYGQPAELGTNYHRTERKAPPPASK